MSIELMTKAWKTHLKPSLKFVLLALADFSNDNGICFPSIDSIAKKCSTHRTNIIKSVQKLADLGFIDKEIRYKKGKKSTTLYRINIELGSKKLRSDSLPQNSTENDLSSDLLRSEKPALSSDSLPDSFKPSVNRQLYKCASARKRANSASNYSCAFLEFYTDYPRKRDKKRAWAAWVKNNQDEKLNIQIFDGLKKYKQEISLKQIEIKFIKYPAAWLNGQCWEDEYETEKPKLSEYVKCKECGKKICRNSGSGWCDECSVKLFPSPYEQMRAAGG